MRPDFFRAPRGPFTAEILAEAGAHAAREAPRESCGLVRAGVYHPCENIAAKPEENFEISREVMRAVYAAGDLEGVIHSHPKGPWRPSEADMKAQIATGAPWAIVIPGPRGAELACAWGLGGPALFDAAGAHQQRHYCFGVSDCYSIIRDWYAQQRGVSLPDFPRAWEFWKRGERLYEQHFEEAGFELVTQDTREMAKLIEPGDVFLRRVGSKFPNHGGVCLGDGRGLEHFPGRLSQCGSIERHVRFFTHLLRFNA